MHAWLALSSAAMFIAMLLLFAAIAHAWSRPPPATPRELRSHLPLAWRVAWPIVTRLAPFVAPAVSASRRARLRERLAYAGFDATLTVEQFVAGQASAAVASGLLGALLAWRTDFDPLAISLCLAALGLLWPATALGRRIARRRQAILRQLPHDLDIVTLSVEAGLNLGAALAQAARHGPPGPLRDEWQRVLRDVRAGQPRHEALRAMAARAGSPAVANLVAALVAAERQGASLAPILRGQAEQRRTERFLRAERLAMQAPVKMLFPLVLFIFPGTFAILLFPVVYRLLTEGVL